MTLALTHPLGSALQRPVPRAAQGVDSDVAAASRGDDGAFERLYRAHVGRVYALTLRIVCDTTRAEHLTQDVFVRAWERLATFRGESAFGTWLHRLAVNVVLTDCRTVWRRERRITSRGDLLDLDAAVPPDNIGTQLDLDAAIEGLPAGARAVLVLHDIEGYQHAEIAELIGIAIGTSKAQLFRARRLLRERLER